LCTSSSRISWIIKNRGSEGRSLGFAIPYKATRGMEIVCFKGISGKRRLFLRGEARERRLGRI
jgi:hypothetical protein